MKKLLLLGALLAFAVPAQAGSFASIESRASAVNASVEGNNSYHAHLARELAGIAETEEAQHDRAAALEFINMAEGHAAQAGGMH